MKIISMCLLLTILSSTLNAQTLPPDPSPGCENILRDGIIQENGYQTRNWIQGIGDFNNDDCFGLSVYVSGGMFVGDYAYGIVGMDQFTQITQAQEDFAVNLTEVFNSLPLNKEITVVELLGAGFKLGEVVLTKKPKFFSVIGGNSANYWWNVSVRWVNGSTVLSQNNFRFEYDDVIPFNYIWDDADPETPVSMLHLGGNKISMDPRDGQNQGNGGLVDYDTTMSNEVQSLHLGIIESDYLLIGGDRIFFDLNLINGIQSY